MTRLIKIALDVVIQPIKMFIKQLHTSAITFHIDWHALMNQLWNTRCCCRSSTKMRKCFSGEGRCWRLRGAKGRRADPIIAQENSFWRSGRKEISAHLRGRGHDTREISFIRARDTFDVLASGYYSVLLRSALLPFARLQEILLLTRIVSINTPKRRKSKAFRHLLCFYVAWLLAYSET